MIDGLRRRDLKVTDLDVAQSGTIVAATLTTAAVTSLSDANGAIVSNCAGSPSTYGHMVQGGASTIGAGSTVWVVFPTAFSAAPKSFVACYSDHTLGYVATGSLSAGSALAIGATASKAINWFAIGLP